jgi:hypothetical protein
MFFSLFFGLPVVAAVLAVLFLPRLLRTPDGRWTAAFAAAGAALTAALLVVLIFRSTSSTASIGLLFVPVWALAGGLAAGAWGWCLRRVLQARAAWRGGPRARTTWTVAAALVAATSVYGASQVRRLWTFQRLGDESLGPAAVEGVYREALRRRDYFLLAAVAAHPKAPPAVLLELARSDDPLLHAKRREPIDAFDRDQLAVVRKALRNPSLPPEALPLLARSADDYVLGDVAAHRATPVPLLRAIHGRSGSYLVHWGLAGNAHTPADVLEALAGDGDRYTAARLAANPGAPPSVLAPLAGHPDELVRGNVALNPAIEEAVMARLAGDGSERVRFYLATNPSLDPGTAAVLARDPSERVRRYAAEDWRRKPRPAAATP